MMKNLVKPFVLSVILIVSSMMFVGCGNNDSRNNGDEATNNTWEQNDPSIDDAENAANANRNNNVNDTGNMVDDAIDGTGNAVEDAVDGVGNAVNDAANGVENAVDDMTGNENVNDNNNNNTNK